MSVFKHLADHEQIVFASRPAGLQCIIAIHSTVLGPALGGVRFHPYRDEADALNDVLRLSKAMTYKAACAGLDVGGGKAVILQSPGQEKSETLFREFGQIVESLGGRYVAACDMGVTPEDLESSRRESDWVRGLARTDGGSGDSATTTAYGVYLGIKCSLAHSTGSGSVKARHIAIDGVGKVGSRLAALLAADGARVTIADIDSALVGRTLKSVVADVVDRDELYEIDADVISPNAVGGVLDSKTVQSLKCGIVAGGANNQLVAPSIAAELAARRILYAPDFVINAGGLIQVVDELHQCGPSEERVKMRTESIAVRLRNLFLLSDRMQISTDDAARQMAQARIAAASRRCAFWLSKGR